MRPYPFGNFGGLFGKDGKENGGGQYQFTRGGCQGMGEEETVLEEQSGCNGDDESRLKRSCSENQEQWEYPLHKIVRPTGADHQAFCGPVEQPAEQEDVRY